MEQNLPVEFPITATMPAAGPYDVSATVQYLVGLTANPFPEYIGFFFKASDHWYAWNPLSTIFQPPYDTVVANYYDGNQNDTTIHNALNTDSATLFSATFRTNFLGSGEFALKADLARNDIHNATLYRARAPGCR